MKKFCIITGTRAEYGLLYWLMKEIQADTSIQLQLIASGTHLSAEHGLTYQVIEKDGFHIDAKVDLDLTDDSVFGVTRSIGLGVIGFSEAFERLKPDLVILLGDRFETLAAAQAAMVARIPIAHIAGGEITEGAIDEAIRHCLTKLAQYHFVSAEPYRKRVVQLGESPDRVFNVGAIGLDNIHRLDLLERVKLESEIGLNLTFPFFLVTYHPVTLDREGPEKSVKSLLSALEQFKTATIAFTQPNADTENRVITRIIDEFVSRYPSRMKLFSSLGQVRYLSAIKYADVVLGNSSSGIIEVPAFHKPTVNIGPRQQGRLTGNSVIHCNDNMSDIVLAIQRALSSEFQEKLKTSNSPYGDRKGKTSSEILQILRSVPIYSGMIKVFHDLEH